MEGCNRDGSAWHSLRLVVNDTVIATAGNTARLRALWPMAPGQHRFWLEGEATPGAATQRSNIAQITVSEFAPAQVEYTSIN